MSIWRRIKNLFSNFAPSRIDFEDAQRGTDWTELDSGVDSLTDSDLGGEMPCFNLHPDRANKSDPQIPAVYRKGN